MTEETSEINEFEINELYYNDLEEAKIDMEILKENGYKVNFRKIPIHDEAIEEDKDGYTLQISSDKSFTEVYNLIQQVKKQREKESYHHLFEERVSKMLNKDFFIISEEDIKKIIQEEFNYPDYNTKELQVLLKKMATTKDPLIIKGERDEEDWSISWEVWYFTTPSQLKIIFRDYIKDYPRLVFKYNYTASKKSGKGLIGNMKISLGQCISLLRNYNSHFINNQIKGENESE